MLSLATKFAPVRSAFDTASASGFLATEFWLDEKFLLDSDAIIPLALEYPFRYAMHFPNQGPLSDDAIRRSSSMYRALNCTAIVIHQPMFDRYARALLEIDPDLDLAIENHVLDERQFDRWSEVSPGLTLDVEHLWKYTLHDCSIEKLLVRVDRLLKDHSAKLHHVHLPGYRPGGEEHQPTHFNDVLAIEIMNRLAAHGFEKLVVSEAELEFQSEPFLKKDVQLYQTWTESMVGRT